MFARSEISFLWIFYVLFIRFDIFEKSLENHFLDLVRKAPKMKKNSASAFLERNTFFLAMMDHL